MFELPTDKTRVLITYRIEPGCLGPDGDQHVDAFCEFVQPYLSVLYPRSCTWNVVPRHDKALDEIEYSLIGRKLTKAQSLKFFESMNSDLPRIEQQAQTVLVESIEVYLGRAA
ncbi:MAG: hypothetical protein AAF434_14580 [Pseudomonadota bacterium]